MNLDRTIQTVQLLTVLAIALSSCQTITLDLMDQSFKGSELSKINKMTQPYRSYSY